MSTPKYATVVKLDGVKEVLSNLDRHSKKLGNAVERGCLKAAKFLRNKSLELVPVETGHLRDSCTEPENIGGKGFKCDVVFGYTAEYAVWVHEDLVNQAPPARAAHGVFYNVKHADEIASQANGMFKRGEKEQAKFLEQPLRDYRNDLLQIIADTIKSAR